jgi:hypothetical protein
MKGEAILESSQTRSHTSMANLHDKILIAFMNSTQCNSLFKFKNLDNFR